MRDPHRLMTSCQQPFTLLDTQYRMHPAIAQWPAQRFYESRLINAHSVMHHRTLYTTSDVGVSNVDTSVAAAPTLVHNADIGEASCVGVAKTGRGRGPWYQRPYVFVTVEHGTVIGESGE